MCDFCKNTNSCEQCICGFMVCQECMILEEHTTKNQESFICQKCKYSFCKSYSYEEENHDHCFECGMKIAVKELRKLNKRLISNHLN